MKTLVLVLMMCGVVCAEESQVQLLEMKATYNQQLLPLAQGVINAHAQYIRFLHMDDPKKRIAQLVDELWDFEKRKDGNISEAVAKENELQSLIRGGWNMKTLIETKRQVLNNTIRAFNSEGRPKAHPDWLLQETKSLVAKVAAIEANPDAPLNNASAVPAPKDSAKAKTQDLKLRDGTTIKILSRIDADDSITVKEEGGKMRTLKKSEVEE